MLNIISKIDSFIRSLSEKLLIAIVFSMLLLSVAVIVFRWFEISFSWIEPLVRHLVFMSAFLGGVLATGRGTHIGIDIIGKYLESKNLESARRWIGCIITLASFITLFWLIKSSWHFVAVEAKYGKIAFLGLHTKFLVSIIPIGFTLIALRFWARFLFFLGGRDDLLKGQA